MDHEEILLVAIPPPDFAIIERPNGCNDPQRMAFFFEGKTAVLIACEVPNEQQ